MSKRIVPRHIPTYFLYGEAPRTLLEPLLHVETIEARSARHHWRIDPHLHQVLHQIVFVARGRGVAQAEGGRTPFRSPALMLMPAGTVHGFEFEPGTTGHVASISVELLRELARHEPDIGVLFTVAATFEFTVRALRATDVAQAFRMLAREFARSCTGHNLALQGWLEVLLANLLRLTRPQLNAADPAAGQQRRLVVRFSEMVESRYCHSEPLSRYAANLNVSESRLRNACLAMTGQTPIQLLNGRIVLEAKRRLLYTDNPVRTIAYDLGFEDPAYFSRFFSRQAVLSPRAFRARGPERLIAGR